MDIERILDGGLAGDDGLGGGDDVFLYSANEMEVQWEESAAGLGLVPREISTREERG